MYIFGCMCTCQEQIQSGRLLAAISSRPGQSGRCDGYVLEGDELTFYTLYALITEWCHNPKYESISTLEPTRTISRAIRVPPGNYTTEADYGISVRNYVTYIYHGIHLQTYITKSC